jgi:signal transduction histidine kinase/CheY-like chemotaxis protein
MSKTLNFFGDKSIRVQLMAIIMLISTLVLLLSFGVFIAYDYYTYRNESLTDIKNQALLFGSNNTLPVAMRQNETVAQDFYKVLSENPHITYGCVFNERDYPVALYARELVVARGHLRRDSAIINIVKDKSIDIKNFPLARINQKGEVSYIYNEMSEEFNIASNYMEVFVPIYDENEKMSTIYIRADLQNFYNRYINQSIVILTIFSLTLIFTYIISNSLQKIISAPILNLADTMKYVSEKKDYSLRLKNTRNDEIGTLIVGFNEMLTQIGLQNEDLINAKELAENSAKAKEQFLANMSHEIRTPMNGVLGFANLLLSSKETLSVTQREYLQNIKNSADYLLVIINDILDLTKIESGKMEFDETPIHLNSLIQAVMSACKMQADKKGLKVQSYIAPNVPEIIVGDTVRLHQILLNLYSNAVKFTLRGEVNISVSLVREDINNIKIRFAVQDTGIGIPKEKQADIFEIFTQASGDTTRRFGGTGLGLSISRQLVELQNGKMYIESEVGKGSTFSFELTFKKWTNDEEAKEKIRQEKISQDKKIEIIPTQPIQNQPIQNTITENNNINVLPQSKVSILLAEDNPVNQMLVMAILQDWGFDIDIAEHGKQTLEMLAQKKYSLLLLDIHMPEIDGYQVTKLIRQGLQNIDTRLPIIAMTASALKGEREKCLSVGMNEYVAKPFSVVELQEKINAAIGRDNSKKVSV